MTENNIDEDSEKEQDFLCYLNNVKDGAGCVEIWEHIQDRE